MLEWRRLQFITGSSRYRDPKCPNDRAERRGTAGRRRSSSCHRVSLDPTEFTPVHFSCATCTSIRVFLAAFIQSFPLSRVKNVLENTSHCCCLFASASTSAHRSPSTLRMYEFSNLSNTRINRETEIPLKSKFRSYVR